MGHHKVFGANEVLTESLNQLFLRIIEPLVKIRLYIRQSVIPLEISQQWEIM